jgi:hypothetical protein
VKESQILIRRELVHIYSHTETEKTYDLTEDDFAPAVVLTRTLTDGPAGYTPVAVLAYEDEDCRLDIGNGTINGDAWTVEAEGTPETVWFKVRLSKGGGTAAYYSRLVSVSGVPALGKADIALAIEGYAITFDANEGGIVSAAHRGLGSFCKEVKYPRQNRGFVFVSRSKRFVLERPKGGFGC